MRHRDSNGFSLNMTPTSSTKQTSFGGWKTKIRPREIKQAGQHESPQANNGAPILKQRSFGGGQDQMRHQENKATIGSSDQERISEAIIRCQMNNHAGRQASEATTEASKQDTGTWRAIWHQVSKRTRRPANTQAPIGSRQANKQAPIGAQHASTWRKGTQAGQHWASIRAGYQMGTAPIGRPASNTIPRVGNHAADTWQPSNQCQRNYIKW